jgi:integrase
VGKLVARVEAYAGQRLRIEQVDGRVEYYPHGQKIEMPAVIWSDGEPWLAPTVYLRRKAFQAAASGGSQTTITQHAAALSAYATYLESENLDWRVFPEDRSLRPTYRYRGHVLARCNAKDLARSTAANHMSVLRAFYAWAMRSGALNDQSVQPFRSRQIMVRYADQMGLERSTMVTSSDLAIKRPKVARRGVEEGCMPLRRADRDQLLRICRDYFRVEFQLVMKLGFFSGMRLGTIIGLTHTAIRHHFPSPDLPGWCAISVGPEHGIPTKKAVTYHPSMPEPLLRELLDYSHSVRRAVRQRSASKVDQDLLFLNVRGRHLTIRSFSADMTKLRRIAKAQGMRIPRFHFHCTRPTFGTSFVLASLARGHKTNQILPRLMRLLGHASAASSMHYIDWVEDETRMEADTEAYSDFLALPEEVMA